VSNDNPYTPLAYYRPMTPPLLSKIIKGHPTRRTRFHTGRAQFLPLRELPSAVVSFGYRAVKRYPDGPWMTPSAVRELRDSLTSSMSLLELGSGVSTAWYADRVGRVVSIEPEAEWAAKVQLQLAGRANCELRQASVEDELRRVILTEDHFDVVIIDFDEHYGFTRPEAVELAKSVATRIVVLDDSDRPEYAAADASMSGWQAYRFPGMKSVPLIATETTIYVRP
jgi:Methyltransferase domain